MQNPTDLAELDISFRCTFFEHLLPVRNTKMNKALYQPFRSMEFKGRKKSIETASIFGVSGDSIISGELKGGDGDSRECDG